MVVADARGRDVSKASARRACRPRRWANGIKSYATSRARTYSHRQHGLSACHRDSASSADTSHRFLQDNCSRQQPQTACTVSIWDRWCPRGDALKWAGSANTSHTRLQNDCSRQMQQRDEHRFQQRSSLLGIHRLAKEHPLQKVSVKSARPEDLCLALLL